MASVWTLTVNIIANRNLSHNNTVNVSTDNTKLALKTDSWHTKDYRVQFKL